MQDGLIFHVHAHLDIDVNIILLELLELLQVLNIVELDDHILRSFAARQAMSVRVLNFKPLFIVQLVQV